MGRKGKQVGGHMPMSHFERTKKFASSEHGTVKKRLAGHSQYQIGDCALSVSRLGDAALCSPSGYLYNESAILEYLLQKTKDLKREQGEYDEQERVAAAPDDSEQKKRVAAFEDTQQGVIKKSRVEDAKRAATDDLKRVSYWLADAQPDVAKPSPLLAPTSDRPASPMSGEPLKRKELWPVALKWQDSKLVCAVCGKTLQNGQVLAYWIDKKIPGTMVLQSVYDELIQDTNRCPLTDKKIKYTRSLQKSGSSFASSGQVVEVSKYRPTIT
jgi:nitric oxide synthase-interacting protein